MKNIVSYATTLRRVKKLIEGHETPAERLFDLVIQLLILLSLIAFSLETLPGITPELQRFFDRFELFTVSVFTLEYALRLWVAERKRAFVFSFYGLVDLLAILPFYLSFGVDMRCLRSFRLLRVFLVLKLTRHVKAIRRLRMALSLIKEEVFLFLSTVGILLFLSAVGIYYFERQAQPEAFGSVFHSLWWAVVTLTTVGYGDVYPVTTGGRFFTFGVLLIGLGVVAVPAGLVASAIIEAREHEADS